MDLMTNSMERQ